MFVNVRVCIRLFKLVNFQFLPTAKSSSDQSVHRTFDGEVILNDPPAL